MVWRGTDPELPPISAFKRNGTMRRCGSQERRQLGRALRLGLPKRLRLVSLCRRLESGLELKNATG